MERKATAIWRGDVRSGRGSLLTESTSLHQAQYSFGTRFEDGVGTNPEELLAAAHAWCLAMAVSSQLGKIGLRPERLEATATITFRKVLPAFRDHEKPFRLVSSGSWRKPSKIRCYRQRRSDGLPGIKTFQRGDFCRRAARGDGLIRTTGVVTG
jgi:OsmC subfamily peroxiredoxin